MSSRSRKAFTLLELIVVIVILGILALLATSTFSSVKAKATEAVELQGVAAVMREAVALAAFESRQLPTATDVAAALADSELGTEVIAVGAQPATSRPFFYAAPSGVTVSATSTSRSGSCVVGAVSAGGSVSAYFSDTGCATDDPDPDPAPNPANVAQLTSLYVPVGVGFSDSALLIGGSWDAVDPSDGAYGCAPGETPALGYDCGAITRHGDTFSAVFSDPTTNGGDVTDVAYVSCTSWTRFTFAEWLTTATGLSLLSYWDNMTQPERDAWNVSTIEELAVLYGAIGDVDDDEIFVNVPSAPATMTLSGVTLGSVATDLSTAGNVVNASTPGAEPFTTLTGLSFTLEWTCPAP